MNDLHMVKKPAFSVVDELIFLPNNSNGKLFFMGLKKVLLKKPLAKDEKTNRHVFG